jgi:uncharacterized protein YkwD
MSGNRYHIGRAALVAALLFLAPASARANVARETATERAYASAINSVRSDHGLSTLEERAALVESAREHSADMLANRYFAHGANWWKRLVEAGAPGPHLGENLGWCALQFCPGATPERLIRMWLASPEHRATLLNPAFRHLGVGISIGPFRGWRTAAVVTTDFDG